MKWREEVEGGLRGACFPFSCVCISSRKTVAFFCLPGGVRAAAAAEESAPKKNNSHFHSHSPLFFAPAFPPLPSPTSPNLRDSWYRPVSAMKALTVSRL